MPIKVLIVNDGTAKSSIAAFDLLKKEPNFHILGIAKDIYAGREEADRTNPDAICLDYAEPQADYTADVRKLLTSASRAPIVIFSPLIKSGAKPVLIALEAGATHFVIKPRSYDRAIENELVDKIRASAKIKITQKANEEKRKTLSAENSSIASIASAAGIKRIIAIGASTGGTEALKEVLIRIPKNSPAIVIVQHMPSSFTGPFAQRLNSLCQINVKEAKDGDEALANQALIAPGDRHMLLRKSGGRYYVEIANGEKVSGHRPSVDALFDSVADAAGANAVGVILTGMGGDGARGMLKMHKAGAKTVAQDEKTCVVFGMPKVAIELGGVDKVVPLEVVPSTALQFAAEIIA
jgi:two-component system chemotaxis response regulator CheB